MTPLVLCWTVCAIVFVVVSGDDTATLLRNDVGKAQPESEDQKPASPPAPSLETSQQQKSEAVVVIANPIAGPPMLIRQPMKKQVIQEARSAGERAFSVVLQGPAAAAGVSQENPSGSASAENQPAA